MTASAKPTLKQIETYNDFSSLANAIHHVFGDAQTTLSGHRKLVILLRKIQTRAITLDCEEQFNFHFTKTISKMLKVKKGEPCGDRIAKFCSLFVATMVKQEAENPTDRPEHNSRSEEDESDNSDSEHEKESISCEFIDYLIRHLLRGIESRFREVRYRIAQLLAYLVNYITEMDEQLFSALKYSLNRRLYDRESVVRIQAVVAISRFQYYEGTGSLKMSQATKSLINALKHDDSPEVRRAALLNVVKSNQSIPELVERARDVNSINRRLVFSRVSKELPSFLDLDLTLKDNILKWGLNDREPSVRAAAVGLLLKHWLPQVNDDILVFLEHAQVVDSEAMPLAMHVIFEHRHDKFNTITIPSEFWNELTVERAFFIRTFFDYSTKNDFYECIDQNIPELTKLAHVVQQYLKLRESMLRANSSLIDEYLEFHNKKETLDKLVSNGLNELKDIKRRLEKEEAIISEAQGRISGLSTSIPKIRGQLKSFKAAKGGRENEALELKIEDLTESLNEQEAELEELQHFLSEHTETLTGLEIQLKDTEKAQLHRESERHKYLEAAGDLDERYRPFGEQKKELEFVIEQILCVIRGCDFADVAGTRSLVPIITSALTYDNLNEENVAVCMKIIRKASIDENYFSQLCTEIITDIRDSNLGENDETFMSAASLFGNENDGDDDDDRDAETQESHASESEQDEGHADKRRKLAPVLPPDNLLIQCLIVLQYYLEVAEDTQCNSYQLDTLIDTLIRPALVNNRNSRIRFLGYKTLGLFSLIDEGLGASNLKFFGISASKAHDEGLKALCMQIIFDIVSTHGVGILDIEGEDAVDSLSLARLFYSLMKNHEMPHLQAVVAEGLCKLFLADLLVDFGKGDLEDGDDDIRQELQLLQVLIMSYFHPSNSQNQELKQVLAFCIPVYCFSHSRHQIKVSSVSGECFYRLYRSDSEFAGTETLASPSTMLQQLIYWCDPNNVINASQEDINKSTSHFWLAMKLLQVIEQNSSKVIKKLIISNLIKLSISEHIGSEALKGLLEAANDTKIHIQSNKDDTNFSLDMSTEKNLEKFLQIVGDLVTKAETLELSREPQSGNSSRAASATNSRVGSRAPSREASRAPSRETSVGPSGSSEARAVPETTEETDQKPPALMIENANAQKTVAEDLDEIDKMLEDDADVNYEVDMS